MSDHKTIFDKDEHTVTTYEESGDTVTLTKHQDAQPIIDRNAYERNSGVNDSTRGPFGRKVASIPMVLWAEWMKITNGEIQSDPVLLAKFLNDKQYEYLRTHRSTV